MKSIVAEITEKYIWNRELVNMERAYVARVAHSAKRFLSDIPVHLLDEDNDLIKLSHDFIEHVRSGNYDDIIPYLQSYSIKGKTLSEDIQIDEGCQLCVELCEYEGHGSASHLYVLTKEGKQDFEVNKYLHFSKSITGAWLVYLMQIIERYMPMFWHALYGAHRYIFDQQDVSEVNSIKSPEQYDVRPCVFMIGNLMYVRACYFTLWGGLIRRTYRIDLDESGCATCVHAGYKELFHYYTSLRY